MKAKPHHFVELERSYARLLGRHLVAEKDIEGVIGLKAIIQADQMIQARRRKIERRLEGIAGIIRGLYDPEWEPEHIRPIVERSKPRYNLVGVEGVRVLKAAEGPMKTREVAHEVARRFEASTDYLTINRITIAVTNFFTRRWKEGLLVREGKPYMWSVKVRPPIRTAPASANSLPKPWTPGASSSRA